MIVYGTFLTDRYIGSARYRRTRDSPRSVLMSLYHVYEVEAQAILTTCLISIGGPFLFRASGNHSYPTSSISETEPRGGIGVFSQIDRQTKNTCLVVVDE